jgi:hypothetical protein
MAGWDHHSTIAHGSASPPLLPDRRLSRVRLAASAVWVFSPRRLPRRAEVEVHAHLHPARLRLTPPRALGSVDHQIELNVSGGVTRLAITGPSAPVPLWGVTPPRGVYPQPRPALPGPQRSYGLMRQTSSLSRPPHGGVVRESWQVAAYPCWAEALREGLSPICVEVLGPVPRRAASGPRPVASRRPSASPYRPEVRRAEPAVLIATSLTNQCRGGSPSVLFRLPHGRDPQVAPTAAARRLLGSWAGDATQCPCGYPARTGVSRRV